MSTFSLFHLGIFDGASDVTVMEAFCDASENGDFLVVAGYLFRKKHTKPFEKEWSTMLRKYDLEYFHMTDCNRETGPFRHLSKSECDEAARTAIALIAKYATAGFSSGVKVSDFHEIIGKDGYMSNPFSMCVHGAMMMCKNWAERNDRQARIVYVFEAGDRFMTDANHILNAVAEDPTRRAFFNYESHAFLPKRDSKPTQAADIIAWHTCKQHDRDERGLGLRGDFAELVKQVSTEKHFHTRNEMEGVKQIARKHVPGEQAERLAGLAMRWNASNSKQTAQKIREMLTPEILAHFLQAGEGP